MPRPKTISDQTLLDAALEVVRRSGPAACSFATVGPQVGLAASTIAQRFGTKAALLQATLLHAWDRLDEATAAADLEATLDPTGIVDLLGALTAQYDHDGFADQLLVLREDLRDPVLRARGAAWITTLAAAVERRLPRGHGDDMTGLGQQIVAYWQGIVTVWGFTRPAPLSNEVRRNLQDVLGRLLG